MRSGRGAGPFFVRRPTLHGVVFAILCLTPSRAPGCAVLALTASRFNSNPYALERDDLCRAAFLSVQLQAISSHGVTLARDTPFGAVSCFQVELAT